MGMMIISLAELQSKKEDLSSLNQVLASQLRDLQAQIRSLDADWEGDAADAFRQRAQRDIQNMERMVTAVASYVKALDTIIAQYRMAERKNIGIARN
ncbi:MAG: WXG100 family type VII secretion target [Lachnospiraceae bacterium]|nr:WXG100 family type VII secretion target [Lachnospiraceae bacterium]